jgi:hypothetical protein
MVMKRATTVDIKKTLLTVAQVEAAHPSLYPSYAYGFNSRMFLPFDKSADAPGLGRQRITAFPAQLRSFHADVTGLASSSNILEASLFDIC